jgi:hypothetical protein
VLTVGVGTLAGIVMMIRTHDFRWLVLTLPFLIMLLVASRYAPSAYRLGAEGVYIERKVGAKVIRYRDIRSVDRERRSIKGLTFGGSNGLFGRFGRFWNPRLGMYRLFLSNTSSVVWLATSEGWVAVSPDRPDDFVAGVQARLAEHSPPR